MQINTNPTNNCFRFAIPVEAIGGCRLGGLEPLRFRGLEFGGLGAQKSSNSLRLAHPANARGGLEAWRLGGLGKLGVLVCLIWNKKSSKVELQK